MKLINRFTSNYKKNPESKIAKLMSIFDLEFEKLKQVFLQIELYRQIDKATGVTLDNIGNNVLEERGGMDDIMYRLFLKTKIKANLSGGQVQTLNEILEVILGENFLGVREVWGDASYSNEPAAFEVRYKNFFEKIKADYEDSENDPYFLSGQYLLNGERFLDGGLTFTYADFEQKILDAMQQTKDMVNFIKAGGVRVWWCEPVPIVSLINILNSVKINIDLLTQNTIDITHSTTFELNQSVNHYPQFILDGSSYLNGVLLLDGIRPIITHSVTVTEVTA